MWPTCSIWLDFKSHQFNCYLCVINHFLRKWFEFSETEYSQLQKKEYRELLVVRSKWDNALCKMPGLYLHLINTNFVSFKKNSLYLQICCSVFLEYPLSTQVFVWQLLIHTSILFDVVNTLIANSQNVISPRGSCLDS